MAKIPEKVIDAWNARNCPPTLTTVNKEGIPNSVYVTNITLLDGGRFAVADGAFSKTRENILAGSPGALLFLSEEAAYQIKGRFEYHTEGPVMEEARQWADFTWPVHAIAVLKVQEIYAGSEKVL